MKTKGDDVEGRRAFERRMNYEPNIARRHTQGPSLYTQGTSQNDYLETIKERRAERRNQTNDIMNEDVDLRKGGLMMPPKRRGTQNVYSPGGPISEITDINVFAEENIISNPVVEQTRKPKGTAETPAHNRDKNSMLPNKMKIEGLPSGQKSVGSKDPGIHRSIAEIIKQNAMREVDSKGDKSQQIRDKLANKYSQK